MAAEGSITFLALEVKGNQSGKALTYANSGASFHLSYLEVAGGVENRGTAALTVPMQKLAAHVMQGSSGQGDMTVPLQVALGWGGGQGATTVPMQTVAGAFTIPISFKAALVVPTQVVAGHGIAGALLRGSMTVPIQKVAGRLGNRVALTVPTQVVAGHITPSLSLRPALKVPIQIVAGTSSVASYPMRGAVTVPMVVARLGGRASLTVPMQFMASSFALASTVADYEAWVINVRNGAVTRFTNFPFTQFTRAGANTYAVGNDGNLYLLGGDLDGTAPIQWEFETGLDNFGSPGLKHIPYLYIDGIIDGEIEIVLLDDRGREFGYEYDTKSRGPVHMQHRRKLGNGVRTVNVGFRFRSTSGAYIELDSFAPEVTITGRNI